MIRETVAHGFTLIEDDDPDMPRFTVTGCLPSNPDSPWYHVGHYDLEEAIIAAGLLTRAECDSESGQFFVYPKTLESARAVGRWIDERLVRSDTVDGEALIKQALLA